MSSTPPAGGRLLVEPLEARIAPTGLVALANNPDFSTQDTYVTFGTQPSAGHLGFVKASTLLGPSAPNNLYALKLTGDGSVDGVTGLSNGDKLLIFNTTTGFNPTNPFLQATDRTLVAFFLDKTNSGNPANDQVTADELVGLALTKKSSANVNGVVNGDIVTNLSKDGLTVSLTSVGKPSFNIAGLTTGNVTGDILAGGSINNLTVHGNVNNVYAGTATNGHTFNFTGTAGVVTGTIAEGAFPDAVPGASITSSSFTSVTSGATIHAGDGGLGAIGGGVDTLAVTAQTAGFNIVGGNGGAGNLAVPGGIGGDISAVTLVGAAGSTANALINIHAGNGGENDVAKAGTGGAVTGVGTSFTTFDPTAGNGSPSPDLLLQDFVVHAGDGGTGLRGGRGGDVTNSRIYSGTPDDGTDAVEVQVIGGHGGLPVSTTAGHGGAGGSVTQVFAEDQLLDIQNLDGTTTPATDTVLVQAGDGGAAQGGGTLSGVSLLGGQLIANAGNGADGIGKGGQGGDLEAITILNLPNLFTHQLTLNAGSGGAASNGPGGAGGEINTVVMNDSDLNFLTINLGTHANGGVGNKGLGGTGGSVLNLTLNDNDAGGQLAHVAVRTGAGGNGYLGGGDGGNLSQFQMLGFNYSFTATAGAGGNVLTTEGADGGGGAGGSLDTVGFSSVRAVNGVFVGTTLADVLNIGGTDYTTLTGAATAGAGGTGSTHGGDGGTLGGVDLRTGFDLTLTAGNGGAAGSATTGQGGSVISCAGVSLGGSVTIRAGDAANAGGTVAADGGSITGTIASAQANVTLTAGTGGLGGAGGSIVNCGSTPNPIYMDFDSSDIVVPVGNFGNILITAGAGTAANGIAGAGGSVTGFTSSVGLAGAGDFSSATPHLTAIKAGAGGGGNGQTASGAGGIVDALKLTGNNLFDDFGGQVVTVDGGAAGVSNLAKRGAAGGGVSNTTIYDLDVDTTVQHVAAGDGATALRHGGAGGTINEVHVGRPGNVVADIGVRDGVTFGYAAGAPGADVTLDQLIGSAGGLFAGVGGTFTAAPNLRTNVGQNGDVTNITAAAISSIVAGKTNTIHLVHLVDAIDLEGNTPAYTDGNSGAFPNFNFDSAQVVGSIYNNGNGSTGAGASTFKQGDGLIAATTITSNRNFTPEASLTYEPNNPTVLAFLDLLESTPGATSTATTSTTIPVSYSL